MVWVANISESDNTLLIFLRFLLTGTSVPDITKIRFFSYLMLGNFDFTKSKVEIKSFYAGNYDTWLVLEIKATSQL